MKKYLLLVVFFATGCAQQSLTRLQLDNGLEHLNANRNQAALDSFNQCATAGVADCYNNIGFMYSAGKIQSANKMQDAIRYYTLAARMGSPTAQKNLLMLGYDLPPVDLVMQPQQRERSSNPEMDRMMMEAWGNFGRDLGYAIGSGAF